MNDGEKGSSMLSVGVDVVEIARWQNVYERHGERFLRRCYTPLEVRFARGRLPELAARFAAKEAISKALGTGLRGIKWREMEILPNRRGKPLVVLHGSARARAERLGLTEWAVSLTHEREIAIAFVVAQGAGPSGILEEDAPYDFRKGRGPHPPAPSP